MHQVGELQYFLFRRLESVSGHLPDGGIEADVQALQLPVSQSDDSLYLLPEGFSATYILWYLSPTW